MTLKYAAIHEDRELGGWPSSFKLHDEKRIDSDTHWGTQGCSITITRVDEPERWISSKTPEEALFAKECHCSSFVRGWENLLTPDRSVQLELLPSEHEIAILVDRLDENDLRQLAQATADIIVTSANQGDLNLPHLRLFNEWWGSMEETVAAGDCLDEILERRYKDSEFTE